MKIADISYRLYLMLDTHEFEESEDQEAIETLYKTLSSFEHDVTDIDSIGERIRNRRLELGMMIKTLSEKSGVHRNTIEALEYGQTKMPDLITVDILAPALGVTPEWLAYGRGEKWEY